MQDAVIYLEDMFISPALEAQLPKFSAQVYHHTLYHHTSTTLPSLGMLDAPGAWPVSLFWCPYYL